LGYVHPQTRPRIQLKKKVGDSSYPYPNPINVEIFRQNGYGFGQYP